jgi:hypothetical protein
MTEADWLASDDPQPMLGFLQGKATDRQLRLFAVACCRRMWHLLTDERGRRAVEAAERFAEGMADEAELRSANLCMEFDSATLEAAAFLASVRRYDRPSILFRYGIVDMTHLDRAAQMRVESICLSGFEFPTDAALAVARRTVAVDPPAEASAQAALLRCVFGNLYRPAVIDPDIVRWSDGTVVKIARAIHDDRAFDRMPVLGDALEDAGCRNPDILAHCRQPGPHTLGCWVIDSLLGEVEHW